MRVGMTWDNLAQPWMSWKPRKLHNFELKKNVSGRKKEEEYRIQSRLEREATKNIKDVEISL